MTPLGKSAPRLILEYINDPTDRRLKPPLVFPPRFKKAGLPNSRNFSVLGAVMDDGEVALVQPDRHISPGLRIL